MDRSLSTIKEVEFIKIKRTAICLPRHVVPGIDQVSHFLRSFETTGLIIIWQTPVNAINFWNIP